MSGPFLRSTNVTSFLRSTNITSFHKIYKCHITFIIPTNVRSFLMIYKCHSLSQNLQMLDTFLLSTMSDPFIRPPNVGTFYKIYKCRKLLYYLQILNPSKWCADFYGTHFYHTVYMFRYELFT